jgi:hypothetical protein
MNFSDFFIKGLRNTLKLRNGANFSFKGQEIRVPKPTIVDQWMAGEFATAAYEIVIERGVDHVEHVNLLVTARVNQVSVVSYGRLNLGKDLVKFTATSDDSKVTLVATPYYEADGVTVLSDIKLTFKATYSERLNPLGIPTVVDDSTNIGGEIGVIRNWNNSNLPNGFLEINNTGSIIVSALNSIAVSGQSTLASDFVFSKIKIVNTDNSIAITTNNSTNTLTFNLTNIANLNITGQFNIDPVASSTINNVAIGVINPKAGTFAQLNATGFVNIVDGNQQVTISPTGTVTINPETTGNINNVTIGGSIARSGTFSQLSANGHVIITQDQTVTIAPSGTGTVTINPAVPGSIDKIIFGAITPASARFSSITLTNTVASSNYLIAMSQLKTILLGASA